MKMVAKQKKVVQKVVRKGVPSSSQSKPVKKAEQSKPFYIGIPTPSEKRRILLESTADFLKLLKYVELHRQKRAQKKVVLQSFHKVMQDIRDRVAKVHKVLPKYKLPSVRSPESQEVEKPANVIVKSKPQAQTEVESLESELASIERKLKGL